MKRVFAICAMLVGVAAIATSCLWSDDDVYKSTALVSVVDGDATTGPYVIFESGQRAIVEKGDKLVSNIPASAYYPNKENGEARAVIYYSSEALENDLLFAGKVNIEALKPVNIKLANMSLPEGMSEEYNDHVLISNTGITYSRNRYVNLQFLFPTSGLSFDSQHKFELVYNPSRTGFFASAYPEREDSFLYLELYHDAGNDPGRLNYSENIISFYLDDLMIGRHIPTEYMGIRILYRNDGDLPKMAEYRFEK